MRISTYLIIIILLQILTISLLNVQNTPICKERKCAIRGEETLKKIALVTS